MDKYEDRLNKAMDLFNNGFTSKASKKRVNDLLNIAYDDVRDKLGSAIIEKQNTCASEIEKEALSDLYWSMPDLHNWKNKHNELFASFPEFVSRIIKLVDIREATKKADLIVLEKNPNDVKVERVRNYIADAIAKKKNQYVEGLALAKYFGGLRVSVNAHYVVNDKGTRFIRHFFYLNGKLTSLNMILSIAEEFNRSQAN